MRTESDRVQQRGILLRAWVLLLLIVSMVTVFGCSKTNVGSLFNVGIVEGDPAESGFGDADANGAYDVRALMAGALFVDGAPELKGIYPRDGATGVDVTALIVLRFSETLGTAETALSTAITVESADPKAAVDGEFSYVDGSANRIVVFDPTDDLADETEYAISLTSTLVDATGDPSTSSGTVSTFTTGKAGDAVAFEVIDSLSLPVAQATGVSERAEIIVFFTEAVDTASVQTELAVEDRSGVLQAGTFSFPSDYGDRVVVFTPAANYPINKRIDVTVDGDAQNADQSEELGSNYTFSFTTIAFPRVSAIGFNAGDPIVALPANFYEGTILTTNQEAFKITVTLAGPGKSERLVLIFRDTSSKAIVVVDEAKRSAGTYTYTIDFKPEETDAISDGKITVGAYTVKNSVNSPVAPAPTLPNLLKDLVAPELDSLGPPSGIAAGNRQILLDVGSAGIHGRASEDLADLSITVDVNGVPQVLDGLVFFSMEYPTGSAIYSQEVTRGNDDLFITEPLVGIDVDRASQSVPFTVTEVVLTDLAGNVTTLTDPADSSVDYRGYIDSLAAAANELEVFCYDASTLLPVENADVLVDQHSDDYGSHSADRLGAHTGADGIATFAIVSALLPENAITVTVIRDNYEITSILGLDKPLGGTGLKLSVPLSPMTGGTSQATVFVNDAGGAALPNVYFGGNQLQNAGGAVLHDAGVDPTDPLNPVVLTTGGTKLQFVEALGVESSTPEDRYQWAWSNPFLADGGVATEAVLFTDTLSDVADLTVQDLETLNLIAGYSSDIEARLTARLDGFGRSLPLAVDLAGLSVGGGEYSFVVPLVPSLLVNEVIGGDLADAAFDPPYEVVIEPALGPADYAGVPDQTLLEGALFFGVEEANSETPPRIIRKRIAYEEAGIGTTRTVTFPETGGSPIELWAIFTPSVFHPLRVYWNSSIDLAGGVGAYILWYSTLSGSRTWKAYVPHTGHTAFTSQVFFPDLSTASLPAGFTPLNDLSDYTADDDYTFYAEAFELPAGFDLHEAFLSDIERDWVTYWRGNLATGSLESP